MALHNCSIRFNPSRTDGLQVAGLRAQMLNAINMHYGAIVYFWVKEIEPKFWWGNDRGFRQLPMSKKIFCLCS